MATEKQKEYYDKWYQDNKEYVKERNKKYRENNKKMILEREKGYRILKKEVNSKAQKQYYQENKDFVLKRSRQNYEKNKESIALRHKQYLKDNKDAMAKYQNEYRKNKRDTDVGYKMLTNCRHRIRNAIKRNVKSAHTQKLLSCTIEELKQHLEKQFTEGMSWENYGKWHVDHIMPCASFDFTREEEQFECFNYKNLQPLWANDNIKKSNKL